MLQRLEWYDLSYDKDYQGVIDVIALPDPRYALVSVQRSSVLIVHDLETGKAHQKVALGTQLGNPRLTLRDNIVWATDYDTLVQIDLNPGACWAGRNCNEHLRAPASSLVITLFQLTACAASRGRTAATSSPWTNGSRFEGAQNSGGSRRKPSNLRMVK